MKGPYERLKYDLRRLWKCPACNRVERTSGGSTNNWCACQVKSDAGTPAPMVLVEDGVRRVLSPPDSNYDPSAPEQSTPETSRPDNPPPETTQPDNPTPGDTPQIE